MKRGLKHYTNYWLEDSNWVEESAPMKRGLKHSALAAGQALTDG